MELSVKQDEEKKDYYKIFVNDTCILNLERSELRHFIELCDNAIGVGLEEKDFSMSADEFGDMIAKARAAALSADPDEDCEMCGS